jgi:hypothetical protein
VVAVWPTLPEPIRRVVLALVGMTEPQWFDGDDR